MMILQAILHYFSLVEIKDFNPLIDNKSVFEQNVKIKHKGFEKLIEMWKNGNNTTGNLLDYLYHQNFYKFIGKYLFK